MKTDKEHSRAVTEDATWRDLESEEDIRHEIELLIDDCRGALYEVEGSVGSHRSLMYVDDLTHSAERLSTLLYQLTTKADDAG